MQSIPIGAFVDVCPSPTGPLAQGWYLGSGARIHQNDELVYLDGGAHTDRVTVGGYRSDQIALAGSTWWAPKPVSVSQRLKSKLTGKPVYEYPNDRDNFSQETWPAKIKMCDPLDFTTNYTKGDTVRALVRGQLIKVKVVTEFRNEIVFRYPVGTTDSRPLHEIFPEKPDSDQESMRVIEAVVAQWKDETLTAKAAVSKLRGLLK